MAMAIQRRMKEIGGSSDLTKGLAIAGGVGAGVLSGGNPAAISAGASLGNTVGGMSDGDRQKSEIEEAQKKDPSVQLVQKGPDDFDKLLSLGQAGAGAYNAMPEPGPPKTMGGTSNSAPMQNSAMARRMKMYGGY